MEISKNLVRYGATTFNLNDIVAITYHPLGEAILIVYPNERSMTLKSCEKDFKRLCELIGNCSQYTFVYSEHTMFKIEGLMCVLTCIVKKAVDLYIKYLNGDKIYLDFLTEEEVESILTAPELNIIEEL